jgi:DNA-binding GntR family transcriptional regulator
VRNVTPADVEEVFFLRLELESQAARFAVRIPPAQIDAMEAKVRQLMISDPTVNDLHRQTDYEFHALLGREFGNSAVMQTIAALHRRTCIFDHTQVPERFLVGCKEHLDILDAVRSGNADIVEQRLRTHLEHARDAVLNRLRPRGVA